MTNTELAKKMLAYYVDPRHLDLIEPAFSGDADAALALSYGHEKRQRGVITRICYEGGMPKVPFREVLGSSWDSSHEFVMNAASSHERLRLMFKYAEFPIPDELPETIRVWRGVSGISAKNARQGFSWTTDRNVACWFAIRLDDVGKPLVITAQIPKRDVLYYSNDRTENELLLLNPPKKATIDGSVEDWESGCLARDADVENHKKKEREEMESAGGQAPISNTIRIVSPPEPTALLEYLKRADVDYGMLVRFHGMPQIDHKSTLEALEDYARMANLRFRNIIEFEAELCKIDIEYLLALHREQIVSITAYITDSARIKSVKTPEELFSAIKERSPDRYVLITKAALVMSGSAYEPYEKLRSEIFDRITELKNDPKQWQDAVSKGAALLDTTRSRQEKIEALLPISRKMSLLKTYQRWLGISA
jgi:hypothetical protein